MLRDLLCGWPEVATWPCDEINLMWRHGNVTEASDVFTRSHVTPAIRRYIRESFARLASRYRARYALEKTCANSLRVGFVDEILPEARFIFVVRHGIDAAMSAVKRWHAPLDLPYTLRKLRWVPPSDLPYYGLQFFRNRASQVLSREHRLSSWGPRFPGMADLVGKRPIEEVCALQWQQCVERAEADLGQLPAERVFRIKYEEFVQDPRTHLLKLRDFLGITTDGLPDVAAVRADLVGRGRRESGSGTEARLQDLLGATLQRYGYA